VIDPGHGGKDPGATRNGVDEADINLSVALHVKRQLEPDYKVILTRDKDADVSLELRAKIANDAKANLFVSIHCNSAENPEANGFEVFHYEGSERSQRLANLLHMHACSLVPTDRKVKATDKLYVLKHTRCPAALVEQAFISNSKDRSLLANPSFQLSMGKAIASAIKAYK
jgi:N-acetylmuramoyl-L-alanine amidase